MEHIARTEREVKRIKRYAITDLLERVLVYIRMTVAERLGHRGTYG